ncbi:hypothetical protein GCM10011331_01680 [Flavimobilis marinus]|uniref:alpha-amylase n=1 Tax=Flavimobilis marinus TaxID=285351 RepID=A0A1I2E0S7_9MICO|nr:carboxypeptidase-like regulatory domain-containing protein [Flavimobilis marinus]GHG43836.1 hypothetical protein GCM10011331_01680 [Flavimobilis marinus]SFE86494.1 Carboxypeptidase regulatory-like domain-containing protein [Flavimobilis marinus]
MIERLTTWVAIAAVVLAGLVAGPAQAADHEHGAVTGAITAGGGPLPRVVVSFQGAGSVRDSSATDSGGRYARERLAAGEYTAFVEAAKADTFLTTYYPGTVRKIDARPVQVRAGQTSSVDIAVCDELGHIRGRVLTPAGKPAKGLVVYAQAQNRTGSGHTSTDARGYYVIKNLPVDSYTVTVPWTSWSPQTVTTTKLRTGVTTTARTLRLDAGPGTSTIVGTVTAAKSVRKKHALGVTAFDSKGRIVGTDLPDARGRFVLTGLRAGTHTIVLDGTNQSRKVKVKRARTASAGTFARGAGTVISGVVKTSRGGRAKRAEVVVTDRYGTWLGQTRTDARGRYRLPGAISGRYRVHVLQVRGADAAPRPKTVTVKRGKRATANLRAARAATLSGRVVAAGKGVRGISVQVSPVKGDPLRRFVGAAVTKADGSYSVSGLPAGTYRISTFDPYVGGYLNGSTTATARQGKGATVRTITLR